MLVSRRGKVYNIISRATGAARTEVQYIAALVSLLELVASVICIQALFGSWSEITIVWPMEITFSIVFGLTFFGLKIAQLFSIASGAKDSSKFLKIFLLAVVSIICLTCGVLACRVGRSKSGVLYWDRNSTKIDKNTNTGRIYDVLLLMPKIRVTENEFNDSNLRKSMNSYDISKLHMIAWDIVQAKYECCGTDSANDWVQIRGVAPRTCCQKPVNFQCKLNDAYEKGCTRNLRLVLFEQTRYIEITLFLLIILESVIASITMFKINCEFDTDDKAHPKGNDVEKNTKNSNHCYRNNIIVAENIA